MVEVTQADRDAAVRLAHSLDISCEDFTSGAADILLQAFVAHRLAVEAGIVAWLREFGNHPPAPNCERCNAADAIARREHAGEG